MSTTTTATTATATTETPTPACPEWSDVYGPATLTAADGLSRVVLAIDDDPHPPESDFACPVIRIDPRGYGATTVTATGYGAHSAAHDGTGADVAEELDRLARAYGWDMAADIIDRWLRVFHGGSLITNDTRGNGGGDYVYAAYDTRAMRAHWGQTGEDLDTSAPDFGEWLDYVEGDVWSLKLEEREFVPACDHCNHAECGEEEWTETEWVHGYYGEEWARQAAEDMLGG